MKNTSKYTPAKKKWVLIYIGDTEFFNKKIAGSLIATDEAINRAISEATEGIIIAKGSEAFKEGFDKEFEVGEKISFKGYHGQIHSEKSGAYSILGKENPNKSYYRSIEDIHVELFINEN